MPTAPVMLSRFGILLSREIGGEVYYRTIGGIVRPLSGTDPDPKESARWKAARAKHIEQAMRDRQSRTVHVHTAEGEHVLSHNVNRFHHTEPSGKTTTTFHDHERAARSAVAEKAAHVEHEAHVKGDEPHTQSAVAIDEETAEAVKHGKLTVPTEGGEIDPDLAEAYKRHAAKLGYEVGEWKHDQKAGTATATLVKRGGEGAATTKAATPATSSRKPVGELSEREVNRRATRVNELRAKGVPTHEAVRRAGEEARARVSAKAPEAKSKAGAEANKAAPAPAAKPASPKDPTGKAGSAADIGAFFKGQKNAVTDSFVSTMWERVQKGEAIPRMGALENKLRDAQKAGALKGREDVARIAEAHFGKGKGSRGASLSRAGAAPVLLSRFGRGMAGLHSNG